MKTIRQIEFLRNRHVPDLAECGAIEQIGDDHVHCNNAAVLVVRVDGHEDYVCHEHLTRLCKEKWPVNWKNERKAVSS
jgi:hypothetical protein